MRLPWQRRKPPLAVQIARTLERRGVGIKGLAVETRGRRATLRGIVASDVAHDRALELVRAVDGVESIDDRLSVVDPNLVRTRRVARQEDCTAIYVTRAGDTLPTIAERVLGDRKRWKELRSENDSIVGEGPLAPGLRLKIPETSRD
ncbi:MAG: BON domain-containing protein [Gemmatimonadaceae bacterium]